jgi:parallel beta-helix repeat protein
MHATGSETVAIQLGDPQYGGVFNNKLHNNTLINHDCAVKLSLSSNNTIAGNLLKDCNTGVLLGASHFNVFTENNITSCQYAVGIHAASSNNTFYYNNFLNNSIQCIETHSPTLFLDGETYSTENTWDNGTIGNYWSTYTGVDTNGDGIGDTPYQVFEYMTDNYPLMTPIHVSTNLPQYDTTPTPTNPQPSLINRGNLIPIIIIGIIIGVIIGLIIYFRRLIFR